MTIKVAIQGQQASFHDIATKKYFGADYELIGCDTFAKTFEALKKSKADKAVIAIENSLFGSINQVYDLFLKYGYWIEGEVYLRIQQCLIGLPGAKIENITEVHSQLEAIAQCEAFLDNKLPNAKRLEHHDTAASVEAVKEWNNPSIAAIASKAAAKLYNMNILAEEIETHKQNYTRFVVLGTEMTTSKNNNKTSLVISTTHTPGALYKALGTFANKGLNLSKLQSRPIVGKAWHYIFYVDVEAGIEDPNLIHAITELKKQKCDVNILGSYQASR